MRWKECAMYSIKNHWWIIFILFNYDILKKKVANFNIYYLTYLILLLVIRKKFQCKRDNSFSVV